MQKIIFLGLDIKELPYFEVFDLQWPQITSEVKIFKLQILIDTIRVYMQKIASLSVFIKLWPHLAYIISGAHMSMHEKKLHL